MRHSRIAATFAAATIATSLLAGTVQAQTIVDLRRGTVLTDAVGEPDELALTATELEEAGRRVRGRLVGIVVPGPGDPAARSSDAIVVGALTERLSAAGAETARCETGPEQLPGDCIDGFVRDDALAIVIVGDHAGHGDLGVPVAAALEDRIIVASVGAAAPAPGAIGVGADPIAQAVRQGRAAGIAVSPLPAERTGPAILLSGRAPTEPDPVADAGVGALAAVAPKVTIAARVGPPAIHTGGELAALLASLPAARLVFGEGLVLDALTPDELASLDPELRLVPWTCDGTVAELVDPAGRIRSCIFRRDALAGETAANAILAIMTSRDVPGSILVPLETYRGRIPVGAGSVELGRRADGARLGLTDAERTAGLAALAGRTIGVIPGPDLEAAQRARTGLSAALEGAGTTLETCDGAKPPAVLRCVQSLAEKGVAAIVLLGTGVDASAASAPAVAAGIPVIALDPPHEGDLGEVSIGADPRAVALLSGRSSAAWAEETWPDQPVEVVVVDRVGAKAADETSALLVQSLLRRNPQATVVARLRAVDDKTAAGVANTIVRRFPGTRLVVGSEAWRLAGPLLGRPGTQPDLAVYALTCTAEIRAAIDARATDGGTLRGCVDPDPERAGILAGEALLRILAGGSTVEVIDVPVRAYPG